MIPITSAKVIASRSRPRFWKIPPVRNPHPRGGAAGAGPRTKNRNKIETQDDSLKYKDHTSNYIAISLLWVKYQVIKNK